MSNKKLSKMIITQTVVTPQKKMPANETTIQNVPLTVLKKRWIDNDIILNMGFRETLVRGGIVLFLLWPLLAINPTLLIYAAPVMSYLLITVLLHVCYFKYAWQQGCGNESLRGM